MDYSLPALRRILGDSVIRDDSEYLITKHGEARTKTAQNTHREVGLVPDGSLNEGGTMVVLEVIPPSEPVIKKLKKAIEPVVKTILREKQSKSTKSKEGAGT